jgi:preprotein translocase subunit SecD
MSSKLRNWLFGIIVLFLLALLVVTEPLRWGARVNADTGRPERWLVRAGNMYVYPPVPRVRLGLDLRGGSHIVLRGQPIAVHTFNFSKEIAPDEEAEMAFREKVDRLLPELSLKSPVAEVASRRSLTIRTQVRDAGQANDEGLQLLDLLRKKLGDKYGRIRLMKDESQVLQLQGELLNKVVENLERRVNSLGLSEAVIQTQHPDKIIVEMPEIRDPDAVMRTLRSTAVLEFRHIPKKYKVDVLQTEAGEETIFLDSEDKEVPVDRVLAESPIIVQGGQLKPKSVYVDYKAGSNMPVVAFSFKPQGADAFWKFTRTHKGQYLAIVLDGKVISSPVVREAIRGSGIIEGMRSIGEAAELSALLNAGALDVPLEVAAEQTVSPTLGADSLRKSLLAGAVGLLLVIVFMALYYRLPGLLADLALMVYCFLVLAVLKLFGATLTLPGIAGFILSIGMAVDANVIIFERLKEELRTEKTLKSAIEAGFNRAWTAILDSNVASILTSLVLIAFGTAAVKGFAITLLIGVAVSMFTAVTITRLFVNITAGTRAAQNLALFGVALPARQSPTATGVGGRS